MDGHLRMLAKERAKDDRDRERKREGVRKLEGHGIDGDAHGVPRADAGGNGGRTAGGAESATELKTERAADGPYGAGAGLHNEQTGQTTNYRVRAPARHDALAVLYARQEF